MKILIVSPHSKCPLLSIRRSCDLRAKNISKKIYERFKTQKGKITDVHILLSDKYRKKIDYNRSEARESQWRTKLKKIIEDEEISVVLEIHSYPSYSDYGRDGTQMVILNNIMADKEGKDFLNHFDDDKIKKLTGSFKNDIQLEIETLEKNTNRKINTYLLEFNEDKTILRNDRLDEIINKIFDYFNNANTNANANANTNANEKKESEECLIL